MCSTHSVLLLVYYYSCFVLGQIFNTILIHFILILEFNDYFNYCFRELSKFNDSLLAKQIWRLKNIENSLFHIVFKAKFFPNCSIMDYESPNKGSFA